MPDLYEDLGVPRDADLGAIKAAGRKAAKETHPDRGGDAEAFARKMRALTILRDPDARRHYDATGDEGDGKTKLTNPVQPLLVQALEHALREALEDGAETVDIPAVMREYLLARAVEGEGHNKEVAKATATLKVAVERLSFTGDGQDFVGEALASKLAQNETNHRINAEAIALYRAAAAYAEAYRYRVNPPPQPPAYSGFDLETVFAQMRPNYAPFHEFGLSPKTSRGKPNGPK